MNKYTSIYLKDHLNLLMAERNNIWKNIIYLEKERVQLYWPGWQTPPIHRRNPTTARHGDFCLLRHRPGPVHPSLDDLGTLGSPGATISMPGLVRTPDQHSVVTSRDPSLKLFTFPGFQAAGLQEHATAPSHCKACLKVLITDELAQLWKSFQVIGKDIMI